MFISTTTLEYKVLYISIHLAFHILLTFSSFQIQIKKSCKKVMSATKINGVGNLVLH